MFYYKKLFLMDIVDCWGDIDFRRQAHRLMVVFFIMAGQWNAIYHTLQLNITNCLAIIVFFWLIFQTSKNTNLNKLLNAFFSWICIPVKLFMVWQSSIPLSNILEFPITVHMIAWWRLEIFYAPIFLEKIFSDTA